MANNELEDLTAIVGPGGDAVEEIDPKPLLEDVGEYSYVEILNPLSVTFKDQVALTTNITASMPVSPHEGSASIVKNEQDIRQVYGFDLRAQAQQSGKTHIITRISLAPGETKKFMGNEAHVIVRHLVSVILQREGKNHLLANAHERRKVEERIVMRTGSLQDALGRAPISVREQLKSALDSLEGTPAEAQGVTNEPEFPGLNQSQSAAGTDTAESNPSQPAPDTSGKRGPGRPAAKPKA